MKETFMWINLKIVIHHVSHRVNKILENTKLNEWNYVSSQCNIADKTGRYQTLKQLCLDNLGATVQNFY